MEPEQAPKPDGSQAVTRRQLLETLGMAGAILALDGPRGFAEVASSEPSVPRGAIGKMPTRILGKTGVRVSALCFG